LPARELVELALSLGCNRQKFMIAASQKGYTATRAAEAFRAACEGGTGEQVEQAGAEPSRPPQPPRGGSVVVTLEGMYYSYPKCLAEAIYLYFVARGARSPAARTSEVIDELLKVDGAARLLFKYTYSHRELVEAARELAKKAGGAAADIIIAAAEAMKDYMRP